MSTGTDSLPRLSLATPWQRTRTAERSDRLHPATAGAFAGGAAGIAMLAVADRLLVNRPEAYDLVLFVGRLASAGRLVGAPAQGAGFAAAFVSGLLAGTVFALVTRHLRKFGPLLLWSLVFFPATWTVLHAFVLPITAPWLAAVLPYGPLIAGSVAFAVVVSFQLPIRKRDNDVAGGHDVDFD